MEGTILKWLKQPGDTIEAEESVLEVATDKVDTDVPAPHGGILKEILANEGDVVQVDKPIAVIETESAANGQQPASAPEEEAIPQGGPAFDAAGAGQPESQPVSQQPAGGTASRFYSPLVLNIARQENIPAGELDTVPGTGKDGRVTKKDILAYLEQQKSGEAPGAQQAPRPQVTPQPRVEQHRKIPKTAVQQPRQSLNGSDEIVEMDRMRRMIADRMVASKQTSPHVTSFVEADVTPMVEWRNRHKGGFKERHGANLTFTPLLVQAVVQAIKDFPMINVSVDGSQIIVKKQVNIGMAVALPSGNLIVPVLKNADHLSLTGMALQINDLAYRARENRLKPDELQGGTYTVSNVGTFGNVMGTPIIVQPQVGIMAFGAIRKKPAVIETPQGDFIGIRQLMFLSHSYDHRVVDGSLGGMFVRRVADYLENFNTSQAV